MAVQYGQNDHLSFRGYEIHAVGEPSDEGALNALINDLRPGRILCDPSETLVKSSQQIFAKSRLLAFVPPISPCDVILCQWFNSKPLAHQPSVIRLLASGQSRPRFGSWS